MGFVLKNQIAALIILDPPVQILSDTSIAFQNKSSGSLTAIGGHTCKGPRLNSATFGELFLICPSQNVLSPS